MNDVSAFPLQVLEGDCRELLPAISDDSIELIFTSPPYANNRMKTYGGVPPDEYDKRQDYNERKRKQAEKNADEVRAAQDNGPESAQDAIAVFFIRRDQKYESESRRRHDRSAEDVADFDLTVVEKTFHDPAAQHRPDPVGDISSTSPMSGMFRMGRSDNPDHLLRRTFIVVARKTEPRYDDCLLRRGVGPRKTGGFDRLGETGDSPYGSNFTANPINASHFLKRFQILPVSLKFVFVNPSPESYRRVLTAP